MLTVCNFLTTITPQHRKLINVVTLLISIPDVSGSGLGLRTGYSFRLRVSVSSVLTGKQTPGHHLKTGRIASSYLFTIFLSFDVLLSETVSLNTH